jgi:hypothetical protein
MNPDEQNGSLNGSGYAPGGSSGDASSAGYAYGSAEVVNNSNYLSEIAAAPPPKQSVWPKRLAIIGGGIALLVALVFIVMNAASDPKPSVVADANAAYGRAATLNTLTDSFNDYFDSSELRAVTAEMQGILASFRSNVTVILEANGVKNPEAPATEAAYLDELDQKFRDARILGNLERTYVSEMSYQIEMLRAMLFGLENKLTVIDQRKFISNTYEELDEIRERLSRIPLS